MNDKQLRPTDHSCLETLYRYDANANKILLDVAYSLSQADLEREFGPSQSSVIKLLTHIYAVKSFFLGRCQGKNVLTGQLPAPDEFFKRWEEFDQEAIRYVAALEDSDLDKEVVVQMRGYTFRFPGRQLLLHPVLHSTQHRGEISVLLSELGKTVSTMDAIIQFAEQSGQAWPWK